MALLPVLSGREVVKAFAQGGCHIFLIKSGSMVTLSVPDHREVAKGTPRSLIRSSGLTVDEFVALSRK
jgi:hypothetical protein